MRKITNTQSGFSLVELMVVVAIIGILATLSVGAIQKQIAKSRQSEAKTNLSTFYGAQKSFAAEFSTFAVAFNVMKLTYEGNLRYNVGFTTGTADPTYANFGYTGAAPTAPVNSSAACAATGTCTALAGTAPVDPVAPVAGAAVVVVAAAQVAPTDAAPNVFTVYAGTNGLYRGNGDQWSIDQNKNILNSMDSIGAAN